MAGFSKGLIEVGISMVLKDQFTQQAGRISNSFNTLMNDAQRWNNALSRQTGVAFDYGLQLTQGIAGAYKHFAGIDKQIFMTSKISGASIKQTRELNELTREVNMQTPLTNLDIASGERYLAMAGNSAEAIKSMIAPAARLASIFDMSLGGKGGTADLMTNIMTTFGLASDQAERVSDVLYTATTSANINLIDLAQSLNYSGASLRNAGIDIQTASAAIGVLGDQGIQASSAGTALDNMIRYLTLSITGQKTKGANLLKALGISKEDLVDANGNLKQLDQVIAVFADKFKNIPGTDRGAALYNIFGIRGMRAASALIHDAWANNKLSTILNKNYESEGATQKAMDDYLNTTQGKIDTLTSAMDNLTAAFGQLNSGPLNTWVSGLAIAVNWVSELISKNGIAGMVVQFGSMAVIGGTIVNGVRLLWMTMKSIVGLTTTLRTVTVSESTAMGSVAANASLLHAHLVQSHAVMLQMLALTPGFKGMMLPLGGRLNINKAGRPYVGYKGKTLSPTTYTTAVLGSTMGAASTGGGARVAAGALAGKNISYLRNLAKFGSMARPMAAIGGVGSGLMGALGGPWGLAITAGLTFLPMLIDSLSSNKDATDENTNAMRERSDFEKMSTSEFMALYNKAWAEAFKTSFTNPNKDKPMRLNININGVDQGEYGDGDTVNTDPLGLWD